MLSALFNNSVCVPTIVYKVKYNKTVVCFLLGDSPASDLYMPTFRDTLSVPSSKAGVKSLHTCL